MSKSHSNIGGRRYYTVKTIDSTLRILELQKDLMYVARFLIHQTWFGSHSDNYITIVFFQAFCSFTWSYSSLKRRECEKENSMKLIF